MALNPSTTPKQQAKPEYTPEQRKLAAEAVSVVADMVGEFSELRAGKSERAKVYAMVCESRLRDEVSPKLEEYVRTALSDAIRQPANGQERPELKDLLHGVMTGNEAAGTKQIPAVEHLLELRNLGQARMQILTEMSESEVQQKLQKKVEEFRERVESCTAEQHEFLEHMKTLNDILKSSQLDSPEHKPSQVIEQAVSYCANNLIC